MKNYGRKKGRISRRTSLSIYGKRLGSNTQVDSLALGSRTFSISIVRRKKAKYMCIDAETVSGGDIL